MPWTRSAKGSITSTSCVTLPPQHPLQCCSGKDKKAGEPSTGTENPCTGSEKCCRLKSEWIIFSVVAKSKKSDQSNLHFSLRLLRILIRLFPNRNWMILLAGKAWGERQSYFCVWICAIPLIKTVQSSLTVRELFDVWRLNSDLFLISAL